MENNFSLDNYQGIKKNPIFPRIPWRKHPDWIKQQLIKTRKALEEAERKMLRE